MGFSIVSYACNKTANCYAKGTHTVCGNVQQHTYGHMVEEPNGYKSWCTITIVEGPHSVLCDGCGAYLRTETRQCAELHSNSHCYSKENLCK